MSFKRVIDETFHETFQHMLPQQDQLDQATTYIKKVREKVETLKRKIQIARGTRESNSPKTSMSTSIKSPVIEVKELGPSLEVILISGLTKNFTLYEVISIAEEEGAEVVSANFSTFGNNVFHTIHAQVIFFLLFILAGN